MILVDSSVWIDHFRHDDPGLSQLLNKRQVLAHPFVIGELALGSLRQGDIVLGALRGRLYENYPLRLTSLDPLSAVHPSTAGLAAVTAPNWCGRCS